MNTEAIAKRVWRDPAFFIAFGFGSGLLPKAPGTWGTLAAIPLYLLLSTQSLGVYLLGTLVAFVLGVWICERVSNVLGEADYGGIVWDEIVGYLLTMAYAPVRLSGIIAGFVLFRLFDIWKPQPIRFIDNRIKGGLGVMLDDVLAAGFAWLVLHALMRGLAL